MTINIHRDELIPLSQAAAMLPPRRRGRKTNTSTLHRWATNGLRGVVLETLRVGGTRCTTLAALQEFFEALNDSARQPKQQSPTQNKNDAEAAGAELEAEGF